ncbi:hypothetical protein [Nonomuraea sp. B1E8]|uniref:hypothetical protein n=1 Tax=unclassified Nonomuraea TaxID=2593643 RepID=UPI00325C6042
MGGSISQAANGRFCSEHAWPRDVRTVAASLTWLRERLYHLAPSGVPPFDDEQVLIDILTSAWTAMLHGRPATGR